MNQTSKIDQEVDESAKNENCVENTENCVLEQNSCLVKDIESEADNFSGNCSHTDSECVKESPPIKENFHKHVYDTFLSELEAISDPEGKLNRTITFMELALSSKQGTPHFKSFWDGRNIALELFKENINPQIRSEQWTKYSDLSKEARRLKEMLDEQSAFASEQIEIAIKALEVEQENIQTILEKTPPPNFLQSSQTLQEESEYYGVVQNELSLLNAHAGRITALRKELIRTEMRVRQKNKFFQRLSSAGDKVFPRRKELIKEISQRFNEHIDLFVKHYFSNDDLQESFFYLREEIKALQSIAKQITLNTQAFSYTRMRLSECWDKLKDLEKERKKVRAQQKSQFRENAEHLYAKLSEIKAAMESNQLSHAEVHNALETFTNELRQIELSRDELRQFRDEVNAIRKPILDKQMAEEQLRVNQVQDRERQRKQKTLEVKDDITSVLNSLEDFDADALMEKKDELLQRINDLTSTKSEKQELERLLKPMKDAIVEKKEKALMSLSDDDRQAILQLKEILKQRKERRQEIKNQLEVFRKVSGSSGLGFEQAMAFNAQIATEKERLEKVSLGITEIETKIAELEKKI